MSIVIDDCGMHLTIRIWRWAVFEVFEEPCVILIDSFVCGCKKGGFVGFYVIWVFMVNSN